MKSFLVSHWRQTTAPQVPEVGNGLRFDGVNQFVDIPVNLGLYPQGTMSFWVYPQGYNQSLFYYTTNDPVDHSQGVFIDVQGQVVYFVFDGDFTPMGPSPQIDLNNFIHISTTWQNWGDITLYINGQFVSSKVLAEQWKVGFRCLIGHPYPNGGRGDNFLTGRIHSLQIYPYVLTAAQIADLHLLPTSYFGSSAARYEFEQGAGLNLEDTSGNNLNGTLINYSAAQTQAGPGNYWVDKFGNPIT